MGRKIISLAYNICPVFSVILPPAIACKPSSLSAADDDHTDPNGE